jgi:group I intron endonuclease
MIGILGNKHCILCKINKKRYIGSSNNISKRFNNHKTELKNNIHNNLHLQRAFNKYGKSNFVFYILEKCKIKNLIKKEQFYLNHYDSFNPKKGFNLSLLAGRVVHTKEAKRKIGLANMNNNYAKGYKHTLEAKSKISKFHYRLNKHSKQHSENIKGKNNPNYTDGRSLKRNLCIDCGKLLARHSFFLKTKRCKSCANKGNNNPSYKKKIKWGQE